MIQIKDCDCGRRCRAGSNKCATCEAEERKEERLLINRNMKSTERTRIEHKYKRVRKKFLAGKKCAGKFPHNCTITTGLTVHHMQGRIGYADEYARENDIPLLIDDRFFMPLCLEAHTYINDHPQFAFENQYSFKRVTDPIFQKKDIL